jgi:hypothetical protein
MRARGWSSFLTIVGLTHAAYATPVWDVWYSDLQHTCPSHHVEWISGDDHDELLGDFLPTLSQSTRRKVEVIVDESRRCANVMGFYCEFEVNLDAFQKLGLLKRFVHFACHARRCEEAAICTDLTRAAIKK